MGMSPRATQLLLYLVLLISCNTASQTTKIYSPGAIGTGGRGSSNGTTNAVTSREYQSTTASAHHQSTTDASNNNQNFCSYNSWVKRLVGYSVPGNYFVVNTIDGKIHNFFLDCSNRMRYLWSCAIDKSQFSHKAYNKQNKAESEQPSTQKSALIPSLNGSLYIFDGSNLSKLKFDKDSTLDVSDYEIKRQEALYNIFGIDITKGTLFYQCVNGYCSSSSVPMSSVNMLLVHQNKHIHTYKSKTGGDNDSNDSKATTDVSDFFVETSFSLHTTNSRHNLSQEFMSVKNIRFHLSEGVLTLVDEDSVATFQHLFTAPIVKMWLISSTGLQTIPLFSAPINPSIDKSMSAKPHFKYIGYYKNSLFIKESRYKTKSHYDNSAHDKTICFNNDYHRAFYEFLEDNQHNKENNNPNNVHYRGGFYIGFQDEQHENSEIKYPYIGHEAEMSIKNTKRATLLSFWKEIILICIITSVIFHISLCRLKRVSVLPHVDLSSNLHSMNDLSLKTNDLHTPIILNSALSNNTNNSSYSQNQGSVYNSVGNNLHQNGSNLSSNSPTNYSMNKYNANSNSSSDNNLIVFTKEAINHNTNGSVMPYDFDQFKSRFFDDFKYINELGRGGFGRVYKCQHNIDSRKYAIKQINLPPIRILQDPTYRNKIYREVKALANFEHPNILRYYHSWIENPPKQYYIMKAREVFYEKSDEAITSADLESLCYPSAQFMQSFSNIDDVCSVNDPNDESVLENGNESVKNNARGSKKVFNSQAQYSLTDSHNKLCILYIQVQLCNDKSLDRWLGYSLAELKKIKNNPLGDRNTIPMLRVYQQLAAALEYVHKQGMVHRDVKPANIFFADDNVLKLGDFGLVNQIGAPSNHFTRRKNIFGASNCSGGGGGNSSNNQLSTTEVGTMLYMSPEMLKTAKYSQKVDIFSMGIILYEIFNHFSTRSERMTKLWNLRTGQIPEKFQQKYKEISSLIKYMLVSNMKRRWNANKVKQRIDEIVKQREAIEQKKELNG